jgi:hypothetical protein
LNVIEIIIDYKKFKMLDGIVSSLLQWYTTIIYVGLQCIINHYIPSSVTEKENADVETGS